MHDLIVINEPIHTQWVCFADDLNEYVKVEKFRKTRMCKGLVKVKWLRHDLIAYSVWFISSDSDSWGGKANTHYNTFRD